MTNDHNIQNGLEEVLSRNGAIISKSHLVLTSGKHSDGYINLRKSAGETESMVNVSGYISEAITAQIKAVNYPEGEIIVIVGPETMGRCFAQEVALDLNCELESLDVRYAWCEPNTDKSTDETTNKTTMRWNSKLEFPDMVSGQHCIIVDDVLTTAKTLKQTIDLIRATGGTVDGVVVIVRRDPSITAETVDVPWLIALYEANLQSYEPDNCPLCQQKIPIMLRPGHGHEWIKDHPGYPTAE